MIATSQTALPWSQLAASLIGVSGAAYLFVHSVMRYDRDYVVTARAERVELHSEVQCLRGELGDARTEIRALRNQITEMCELCDRLPRGGP